jgi:hypothetical protein
LGCNVWLLVGVVLVRCRGLGQDARGVWYSVVSAPEAHNMVTGPSGEVVGMAEGAKVDLLQGPITAFPMPRIIPSQTSVRSYRRPRNSKTQSSLVAGNPGLGEQPSQRSPWNGQPKWRLQAHWLQAFSPCLPPQPRPLPLGVHCAVLLPSYPALLPSLF